MRKRGRDNDRLPRNIEIAGRPRIDADKRHVFDAALPAGHNELRICAHGIFNGGELLELDHRLGSWQILRREHLPFRQRDRQAPDAILFDFEEIDPCRPPYRISALVLTHDRLLRLQELDRLKKEIRAILRIIADDLHN